MHRNKIEVSYFFFPFFRGLFRTREVYIKIDGTDELEVSVLTIRNRAYFLLVTNTNFAYSFRFIASTRERWTAVDVGWLSLVCH